MREFWIGDVYNFNKSDLGRFKRLYKKIDQLIDNYEKNKQINIGISRFNKSYVKKDVADQTIDLVIAVEAMMVDKSADSLRFKISNLTARLLKKDLEGRRELAKKVKEIYDIRSIIVHTGKTIDWNQSKYFKSESDFIFFTKKLIREIILKFVKLIYDKNKIKNREDTIEKITYS